MIPEFLGLLMKPASLEKPVLHFKRIDMNPKNLVPFAIVFLFSFQMFAQNMRLYTVNGQLVDSALHSPVEFATLSIKNKSASTEKKMATDKNGNFIFQKLPAGQYQLAIEMTGYFSKIINIDLHDSLNYSADIGKIILVQKIKQLAEVKVVTKKPLVTQEIDRIIYNVQEDPDSKIFNTLDMMRKVPFISLTGDDQVQLKGSTNFKVLLDGKNSSILSSKNLKDALRGIPASSILQIEVITTPPAKYESEGLGGIINIITNKKLKDGYNGSFSANYSRLFSGVSLGQNLKKGKFGLSAFEGSSWERTPLSPFWLSLKQSSLPIFELSENGHKRYNGNSIYGNSMLSLEFDTLNLLTANVGLNSGINHQKSDQLTGVFDEAGSLNQSYSLYTMRKNNDMGYDAGLNYQRGFKKNKTQLLTLSYRYLNTHSEFENSNLVNNKLNYTAEDFRQKDKAGLSEHTVQLDYVQPAKKITIETGSKWILRNKFSDFAQENFNASSKQFETDPGRSDVFNYKENIFSFYNSYSLKLKSWALKPGFRLEITNINADFKTTGALLDRNYLNLIPSVSFLHRFKNTSTGTAGYTQRIQRPGISLLNPFEDQSDPRFRRIGNPGLLPVLTHNFMLNYSRFKKSSISIGATYTFSRNTIQSVAGSSTIDSIVRITYRNIGKYTNLGTNANLTIPIGKTLSLTGNGNLNYVWIEGTVENKKLKNQGVEGFAYSYLSWRAKKNWRISLNAGFYGPTRNLQGNSNTYFYSSASVSKQIFKQKGNLSLSISNPFQKYRTLRTIISTTSFEEEVVNKNYYRNISVGFYFRFGKLTEEIKKNRRNINNDDKAVETGKTQ
jgi:outer membrane receptor for ferrienterochelin and colicin